MLRKNDFNIWGHQQFVVDINSIIKSLAEVLYVCVKAKNSQ